MNDSEIRKIYDSCTLCPRKCGADRTSEASGYCGVGSKIKIGRAALHFWEEPCISGKSGSGTVFFSGCTLRCVYCQNGALSHEALGNVITRDELCDIFLKLGADGANNINLVTGTQYTPDIVYAAEKAKARGLKIPFLWNSGGYESIETLKMLDGLIDIYLPDLKYLDGGLARTLSKAPGYPETACAAIEEMVRQTGPVRFRGDGEAHPENGATQEKTGDGEAPDTPLLVRGTVVRHLVLPGHVKEAKNVIGYLYGKYGDDIFISIMSQFTPLDTEKLEPFGLSRKLTKREYGRVLDYAMELGVTNAFIQEGEAADESFIPEFSGRK